MATFSIFFFISCFTCRSCVLLAPQIWDEWQKGEENMDKYCNFVPLWLWCDVWDNIGVTQVIPRHRSDRIGNRNWWDKKKCMHDCGVFLMLAVECRRHHQFVVVSLCCGSLAFLFTEHKGHRQASPTGYCEQDMIQSLIFFHQLMALEGKTEKKKSKLTTEKKREEKLKANKLFSFYFEWVVSSGVYW